MEEHGGVILNVASIGGLSVEPTIGAYNATKAALLHLTRTLAAELAPGVRVNAIAPGLVKTDMARALWEPNEEAMARTMPLRRLGEPQDIAPGRHVPLLGCGIVDHRQRRSSSTGRARPRLTPRHPPFVREHVTVTGNRTNGGGSGR